MEDNEDQDEEDKKAKKTPSLIRNNLRGANNTKSSYPAAVLSHGIFFISDLLSSASENQEGVLLACSHSLR